VAVQVARAIGEKAGAPPPKSKSKTSKVMSDAPDELELLEKATTPTTASGGLLKTKGLSMEEDEPKLPKGHKVAILVAAGVAIDEVGSMQNALKAQNVMRNSQPACRRDREGWGLTEATMTFANSSSVLFDAVYVPRGGERIEMLKEIPDALRFIDETYKHGKTIAASSEGVELVKETKTGELLTDDDAAEQGRPVRRRRRQSGSRLYRSDCQPPIP
jgi:catalase